MESPEKRFHVVVHFICIVLLLRLQTFRYISSGLSRFQNGKETVNV